MSTRLKQINSHTMGSLAPTPDIEAIISQLTLEEKASLLAGRDFWTTNAVPRLGVPTLKVSDGPNGARGEAFHGGIKSACFPACVSLAASFDRTHAQDIGQALAEETRTKGATVLLGPTVCPHRDPRGGRNFESFSEDPYLAGELASDYILGLQGGGVGATIKHFAVNESETKRFTIDAKLSQRALREIYLKPFEIAVKKSDPWALMTSYNLINGTHADSNKQLITKVLREQWGFKGLVMSDWGGVNSTEESLNAGHDLEMPGPAQWRTLEKILSAIKAGKLSEQTLDDRVRKVLELLIQTGKFDDPTIPDEAAVDTPAHRELIRSVGADGMVLLKNENNVLPLQTENLKSIALVGLAKEFLGHGGGSAAVNAHHKITAFDGLQEALGSKVEVQYAEGVRILRNLRSMQDDVVDESGQAGFSCHLTTTASNTETKNVPNTKFMSIERSDVDSVLMTGKFTPRVSGAHYISFASVGTSSVQIDNDVVFDIQGLSADTMAMLLGTATEERKQYTFKAGQTYNITIKAKAVKSGDQDLSILTNPLVCFNLGFTLQAEFEADLLAEAVKVAKSTDVAIVFVGHTPVWETEGADRDYMNLPVDGSQDKLIQAVAEVNKNTIVVNSTGSPIAMPWLENVSAVLQAWFPGQEAGHAIADVLIGKHNPSGRLPVTFPKRIEDAPTYKNFPCTGDLKDLHVDYEEDIFIGYRHYDRSQNGDNVLFPFGYGLSYTTFSTSDVQISSITVSANDTLTISATVKNTGKVTGSETLQVYVGAVEAEKLGRPKKELAGFAKARQLQAKQTEKVQVQVSVKESFSHWDEERYGWVVPAGKYTVTIGTSSAERDVCERIGVIVEKEGFFEP